MSDTPEIDALLETMMEKNGVPACDEWDVLVDCAKTLEIERNTANATGFRAGVEAAALAAENVSPRHTECGNKIAAAIRAIKVPE